MRQRNKHSTARDPFSTFREYTLSLTVDETVLAGTQWTSPACKDFFVFWEDFPPVIGMKNFGLSEGLAKLYSRSEVPLVTVSVSLSINMYLFQQQVRAAPTSEELADKFSALKRQLDGVSSLAKGGKATENASSAPHWVEDFANSDPDEALEAAVRNAIGRSPSIHPALHEILFAVLQEDMPDQMDDLAILANHAWLAREQDKVRTFFEMVEEMSDLVEAAVQLCREDGSLPNTKERSPGAPGDEAKDWLLVRLLWIWRDVLGQEIKIYARKIENGVELDSPKPNDCMDFVISVMRHVAPVRPHQIPALERKLTELKNLVPVEPLAILDV